MPNPAKLLFKIYFLHKHTRYTVRDGKLKWIVSQGFGGLQMILMDRIGVRDVPLKDYIFSNSCFHSILIFKVTAG